MSGRPTTRARDRLEGTGLALQALPHIVEGRQKINSGRDRDRTRVGGVHLGHCARGAKRDASTRGLNQTRQSPTTGGSACGPPWAGLLRYLRSPQTDPRLSSEINDNSIRAAVGARPWQGNPRKHYVAESRIYSGARRPLLDRGSPGRTNGHAVSNPRIRA